MVSRLETARPLLTPAEVMQLLHDDELVLVSGCHPKARRDHHTVSVAVIVAVGVDADWRYEGLGMATCNSEAEPFWVEFLRG
jgi:transposase-like protein